MNKFKQFQNLEKLLINKNDRLKFLVNELANIPDNADDMCLAYQSEMVRLTYDISLLAQWLKGDQK